MPTSEPDPACGVIDHYLGAKGEEYFAWQKADGLIDARYNLHIWRPHVAPADDVLDFGCGGGFLLKALDARRKAGVEVNPAARRQATELGIETYDNVREVPGAFDKVISSHALEHVPNPRQALLDLREKLRGPGSRLVLLLPLEDWRSGLNRRYRPDDVSMHLHAWTPQTLGNLLASCDYAVHEVSVIRHAWPPGRHQLWQIHPKAFHAAAWLYSILRKQRQLFAVAKVRS
jgi:SAM-dependent methyltransferase